MNVSLPSPVFPLLCCSIATTTFTLALAAFIISLSPALWIIPVAFILTFVLHAVFLLLSNSEDNNTASLKVFSKLIVVVTYTLATLWTAVLAVVIYFTVRLLTGHLSSAPPGRAWAMITTCAVIFIETSLMFVLAVQIHKVRRQLRYREKWRWRPGAATSQWSIAQA